ncbi:MAG: InlB B-repeat-containing protein, partial [Lachnospiraceae bacterium]|nr:InlB B-repeat-containing protein [Candidatus Hippenecus merdae]
ISLSGDNNVTLTGCRITSNSAVKGGGVAFYLKDNGGYSFKVGKDTVITGNMDTEGNDSNLYLDNFNQSTFITILDGENAPDGMNIGISAKNSPTASAPVQITTASADIGDLAFFSPDAPSYDLIYMGGIYLAEKDMCGVTFKSGAHGTDPDPVLIEKGGLLTRPADPSEYGYSFLGWYKDAALQNVWNFESDPVNGNTVLYGKWEDIAWLALQEDVQSSGTVTLTEDVVCDDQAYGPITIPEGISVTIDLNGHKIDRNLTEAVDKGAVLEVFGSLTVRDGSSAGTGTITGGKNTGSDSQMVAGGVQVSGGSLVLESGNITGCSSGMRGAGVTVTGGSFTMNGGSISGNQALSHGAGVSLTSSTFTMTGGIISGNQANVGAGIYAAGTNLILSGGEISGNTAKN